MNYAYIIVLCVDCIKLVLTYLMFDGCATYLLWIPEDAQV